MIPKTSSFHPMVIERENSRRTAIARSARLP
jgi:hypothetical protein